MELGQDSVSSGTTAALETSPNVIATHFRFQGELADVQVHSEVASAAFPVSQGLTKGIPCWNSGAPRPFQNSGAALATLSLCPKAVHSLVPKSLTSLTLLPLIKSLSVSYTDQSQKHLSHTHEAKPGGGLH